MQLIKSDGVYVARCSYDERHIPKAAGFRWDPAARRWWTDRDSVAAYLREFATPALAAALPEPGAPPAEEAPSLTLRPDGLAWLFRCRREQNQPAKDAGFRWNNALLAWETSDPSAALRLKAFASPDVVQELERIQAQREAARAASRATDADIDLPRPPGTEYLGYQRAGIAYAMQRLRALIGDEMGLGKTIQAIGVMNCDDTVREILILCPATLKLNWRREIKKWSTRPAIVSLATTTDWTMPPVQEGRIAVTIAHYDIFSRETRVAKALRAKRWDMLVVDEAHLLKNPKAGRTRMILGASARDNDGEALPSIQARRQVFLTGTPMVNRPIEMWPLAHHCAPDVFHSWPKYAAEFCGWQRGRGANGASNLDKLQDLLRETFMIRRLKRDVLTDLPAKFRQVIELPPGAGAAAVINQENSALGRHTARLEALRTAVELAKVSDNPADYEAAVAALQGGMTAAFTELSKLRHETAMAKVPDVIAHIREVAEEGSKIIVFAHHRDVMAALMEGLAAMRPVQIHGGVPMDERQRAVDTFQTDPECKLFIGQMTAAGVGITLTASSHVIFAELDWVPGNLSQCEDRAHRIGQQNSVLVQHLVLEGSLDARMAQVLVEKQRVLDGALDANTDHSRAAREAAAALPEIRPGVITATTAAARLVLSGMPRDEVNRILERQDWQALRGAVRQRLPSLMLTEEEVMPAPFRSEDERRRPMEIGQGVSTADARREALEAEGRNMTPAQVQAVHTALRIIAGMDGDRARARNNVGFNQADTGLGNALAERDRLTPRAAALGRRLVRKYHRQIGAELLAEMGAPLATAA